VKESQKARFSALVEAHGLVAEDFFKAPQGFVIITRTGIEKIQRGLGATVQYEVVPEFSDPSSGMYVIKTQAYMPIQTVNEKTGKIEHEHRVVETYGEASPKNCRNSYPVAMAEKRGLSRAILKLADLYELGVYGEDEIEDTK